MDTDQTLILKYIKYKKEFIDIEIDNIIKDKREIVSSINFFGDEGLTKLAEFAKRGKSLRGVLTILGAEMYGFKQDTNLVKLAAIIELIHSSILIQDDIQDDDSMRRGSPTIFKQYQSYAEDNNFKSPKFYGQSIAMDVYLIGHYLSILELSSLSIDSNLKIKLLSFISREVMKVGVAQSQDIFHSYVHSENISIEDIENVHLYKTGRYTLSLPLMLGGLYAGKELHQMTEIEKSSQMLGIIFQVKDDELSIFANEAELGKRIGNDIIENKKTHFRELLYQRASKEEVRLLNRSFGNKNLSERKVEKIKGLIDKYNIREDIQQKMNIIALDVAQILKNVNLDIKARQNIESLICYLLLRTK